MLPDAKSKVVINVPLGKIVQTEIILGDYLFEIWEAKPDMRFRFGAKFEGVIRLKKDSPQNRATEMLHEISATCDKLAFYVL